MVRVERNTSTIIPGLPYFVAQRISGEYSGEKFAMRPSIVSPDHPFTTAKPGDVVSWPSFERGNPTIGPFRFLGTFFALGSFQDGGKGEATIFASAVA